MLTRLTVVSSVAMLLVSALAACAADAAKPNADLPSPWKQVDLGLANVTAPPPPVVPPATRPAARATVAGSAAESNGVFQLQGTMDLWGVADGCHFVYQPANGDVELIARVVAMENPGGVAHAKSSLCLRASTDPGAPHVTFAVTATDGTQFLYRDAENGKTAKVAVDTDAQKKLVPKATFPVWLKLVRTGKEFTAYESADGVTWISHGHLTLQLPAKTVAGIAVSSHKPDVVTKATFDHVAVKQGGEGDKSRSK